MSGPQIAILGGGIGGLATAAFLHKAGVSATVYEQAPALQEVGAGLVVAPNIVRLLRRLGVLDELTHRAVRLDAGWEFRRWQDGQVLSVEDLRDRCAELYGEHTYTAHRAHLLDAVKSAVPQSGVLLGKRCVRYRQHDGRAELTFEDGEVVRPDFVIAADGIHSVVRRALVDAIPPSFSGISAYRALVDAEKVSDFARRPAQTLWIGPGRHLVHYPISSGKLVNLVAFAPAGDYSVESWNAMATVEEFLGEFDGWDSRLLDLIRAANTPGRWALLDREPLETWTDGTSVLLGDAAHPMFPFFGQGAAQAIEDAAVLATLISDEPQDLEVVALRYERIRLPRTTRLQRVSHGRSSINHLADGPEQVARDRSFNLIDPLVENAWIYGYDAEADARRPRVVE
ncbi:FAD-dependent monooxygenase [Microbacterium sp. NPDC058062]|uniref:FAD-dependent monooxygenase n=1 Tax=Microbacterium sp. NPDC058062 TaxID=3346320 RepID=UPI0036DAA677